MGNMFGMGMDPTVGTIMGLTNIGMSVLDKMGVFGKLNGATSVVQQTAPKTNGAALADGLSTLGGNNSIPINSDIALTVGNMAKCADSTSLSAAIGEAKAQLTAMNTQYESLNTAAEQANTNLSTLEGQQKTATKDVADKQQNVATCENSVKVLKDGRDVALQKAKTGNEAYDKATEDHIKALDAKSDAMSELYLANSKLDIATNNYTTAETNYNNLKSQYETANENAKPAIKAQLDVAKQQLENAKLAKEQATEAKNKADEALTKAETEASNTAAKKQEAYNNLGELKAKADEAGAALEIEQNKLDKGKTNLTEAKENLELANDKVSDLQAQIDSQNGIINAAKACKADSKSLSKEIEAQEKRLIQMQKNEKNGKAPATDDKKGTQKAEDEGSSTSTKTDNKAKSAPTTADNEARTFTAGTQLTNEQLNSFTPEASYELGDGTIVNEYHDDKGHKIYVNNSDNTVVTNEIAEKAKSEGEMGALVIGHNPKA